MSSDPAPGLDGPPLIFLVHQANKALQTDMVESSHRAGYPEVKYAHNAVFGTLHVGGGRAVDMAAEMGITRQSMGEIIRDLVGLGLVEMVPDPADGRAKLVRYTPAGLRAATDGFHHIEDLEARFVEEFGEADYLTARRVLVRVAEMLQTDAAETAPKTGAAP